MLCPYRASFVTHSFTQGVAIGLDLFKPFRAFLEITLSFLTTFSVLWHSFPPVVAGWRGCYATCASWHRIDKQRMSDLIT